MNEREDDVVVRRARGTLLRNGFIAVGLGLAQFLCNPFFAFSVAAVGAGLLAIREAKSLEGTLGEDFPPGAGRASQLLGLGGMGLVVVWVFTLVGWGVLGLGL